VLSHGAKGSFEESSRSILSDEVRSLKQTPSDERKGMLRTLRSHQLMKKLKETNKLLYPEKKKRIGGSIIAWGQGLHPSRRNHNHRHWRPFEDFKRKDHRAWPLGHTNEGREELSKKQKKD